MDEGLAGRWGSPWTNTDTVGFQEWCPIRSEKFDGWLCLFNVPGEGTDSIPVISSLESTDLFLQ